MTTLPPDPLAVLTVPWVLAEPDDLAPIVPAVPVAAEPEPLPAAEPTQPTRATAGGIPAPLAVAAALLVALAVVALPAVLFDWFSGPVMFGMAVAGLIALAIVVVAYPLPDNQREYFWSVGSEPVGQCTPSRQPLTGRGDR